MTLALVLLSSAASLANGKFDQGMSLYKQRKFDQAIVALDAATRSEPSNPSA